MAKPDLKAIMGGAGAAPGDDAEDPTADPGADPMGDATDTADPMADSKQSADPGVQATGLFRESIAAGDDEAAWDAFQSMMTMHSSAHADMTPKPKLIGSKT